MCATTCRGGAGGGRGRGRRPDPRDLGGHGRGHRRAARAGAQQRHGGGGRVVGRRQVDPHQPAHRRGAAGDQRHPRRRARASHHDAPRAGGTARRRLHHRYAGNAGDAVVGGRRGRRPDLRRHRGARGPLSFPRLCPRDRARLRGTGCDRRRHPSGGAARSYRKLQRELLFQATRDDKRARSEERRRWAAAHKALKTDAY